MKHSRGYLLAAAALSLGLLCVACGGSDSADVTNYVDSGAVTSAAAEELDSENGIYVMETDNIAGLYVPTDPNSEWYYVIINDDGTWELTGQDATLTGWIGYDTEYEASYAYEDGTDYACLFDVEQDGSVYFGSYGYFSEDGVGDDFSSGEDEVPAWNGREEYYSGNPELYQRAISELQGVWYYDGDLSADRYITIDDAGNWSLYQRSSGDAEGTEMDRGVLSYSDKASTYDASSTWYPGVSYEVFEVQEDTLVWEDEGEFYLL